MMEDVKDRNPEELLLDTETLEWMKERCVMIIGDISTCKITFSAMEIWKRIVDMFGRIRYVPAPQMKKVMEIGFTYANKSSVTQLSERAKYDSRRVTMDVTKNGVENELTLAEVQTISIFQKRFLPSTVTFEYNDAGFVSR